MMLALCAQESFQSLRPRFKLTGVSWLEKSELQNESVIMQEELKLAA